MLKRYEDHELGESASRRVSYHCKADYAKSSRAICHGCEQNIEQNELRLALMLQDEEGYKSTAWNHFDCFWKHPETWKLNGTHEIYDFLVLKYADRKRISKEFEKFNASKTITAKRRKRNDNVDDEYLPINEMNGQEKKKKKVKRNKQA
ncbi:hypothetical protein I4U23_023379 [Adineta vaga]|nr:hypothetical protein I4U23_023379 [Adineta vaga]